MNRFAKSAAVGLGAALVIGMGALSFRPESMQPGAVEPRGTSASPPLPATPTTRAIAPEQPIIPAAWSLQLARLAALPAGEDRLLLAVELLRRWAAENPSAAIDWILADAAAARPLLAGLLPQALTGQTHSEQRRDSAQEATNGTLAAIFGDWVQHDPEAAALKAIYLTDPGRRELMLAVVFEKWADEHIAGAIDLVKALPAGPEHAAALRQVAAEWAGHQPEDAAAYATTLPEGETRTEFINVLAAAWAARQPAAALDWVAGLPDSAARTQAVRGALAALAEAEPATAAAALGRLPAGAALEQGADLVLGLWAARDPAAAVSWYEQLSAGPLRQAALPALAEAWAAHDPAGALRAAAALPDPSIRLAGLESVVRAWLGRDATAARQWLASAAAPAELRARLGPR